MSVRLRFKNQIAFNRALDEFTEDLVPEQHVRLQKKIAIDLFSAIIEKNPVGNPSLWAESSLPAPKGYVGGRSRANWQISITPPPDGDGTDDVDEGAVTGAPVDPSQLADGLGAMASAEFGGTIWIFNNVVYIKRLEDGWSQQAPAGMVAISLAEFEAGLGGA
jgi:hypothetical protein